MKIAGMEEEEEEEEEEDDWASSRVPGGWWLAGGWQGIAAQTAPGRLTGWRAPRGI